MRSKWWAGVALMAAGVVSAPAVAEEQQWSVSGTTLSAGDVSVALPCEGASVAASEATLYVACREGGVAVLDATTPAPRVVEVRNVIEAVPVKRLFTVGDEVWAETALGRRRLVDYLGPQPTATAVQAPAVVDVPETVPEPEVEVPPPASEEPARPAESVVGKVLSLGVGTVVIDVGASSGIEEGRWVEFFALETVDLGGGEVVEQERRVGVGRVETVSANRSKVALALNERVPVGAFARPDPEGVTDLGKRMVPARPSGVWEVSVNARPFLALGTLGGGAILDGSVGHRFEAPVAVDAFFHPFAFGLARDGDILTFAGNLVVSYDTTPFQVGLGAGVSKINTLPVRGSDFIPGANAEAPTFRAGFSAAQFVRLGSVDGLHISVLNNFILFEDEFVFGGITVDGAVPIRLFKDDAWVKARGGGGVPGYVFGELGIRILAVGNGGPGSLFLTPTVGAGVLTGEQWTSCEGYDYEREAPAEPFPVLEPGICRTQHTYGGPLVGFGTEWRF